MLVEVEVVEDERPSSSSSEEDGEDESAEELLESFDPPGARGSGARGNLSSVALQHALVPSIEPSGWSSGRLASQQ